MTLEGEGEYAMLIKDNRGDWAIVKGVAGKMCKKLWYLRYLCTLMPYLRENNAKIMCVVYVHARSCVRMRVPL